MPLLGVASIVCGVRGEEVDGGAREVLEAVNFMVV